MPEHGRYELWHVAMPWFISQEEYERLRLAIIDPHSLPADLNAYLELLKKMEYTYQRNGASTSRVYIDIDGFRQFCSADSAYDLRAANMQEYAQWLLVRLYQNL